MYVVRASVKKLLILAMLIIAGLILEIAGLLDAKAMLNIAMQYSDHWWLVLVLILLQAVLFTFALAGSFFLWIAAPLYPPAMATFILAAGGTIGGIGAYLFSKHLTDDWIDRIENSHAYRLLHQHNNFFTLFAMRVFPAFPHSLVNYSSGILKVKPGHFIAATISGLAIKSYIYSNVIHNATTSASLDDLLSIATYGPLILLSALSLTAVFIRYKLQHRHNEKLH
jgi:uncharacterized membrane protein YdjX (TVP38/TMEM64 family)